MISELSPDGFRLLVAEEGVNRILLVTGRTSFEASGAETFVKESVGALVRTHLRKATSLPDYDEIVNLGKSIRKADFDLILAVGGGGVIDVAKGLNVYLSLGANGLEQAMSGKATEVPDLLPMIAIPTTAGSGSEATHFAVVYRDGVKHSVAFRDMLPRHSIINSEFAFTGPRYNQACSALDALSQGIESYFSVGSTETSDGYAADAIDMLISSLPGAIRDGDAECRRLVAVGSHLAGKAINISKTTAAHAFSYGLTSHFGVPHGHAVFFTLPKLVEYNCGVTKADCADPRGPRYVQKKMSSLLHHLKVDSPSAARKALEVVCDQLGVDNSLAGVPVKENRIHLEQKINFNRLRNNPRIIAADFLDEIYDR